MGEHIQLVVLGETRSIHRLEGNLALSRPFCLTARLPAPDATRSIHDEWLGQPFQLTLHNTLEESWHLTGIVFAVERKLVGQRVLLEVELGPDIQALTLGRNHRVFQDLAVPDIIQSVLDEAAIANFELRLTGSYQPRKYVVQYGESDWTFLERLCAEFGIYYFFELTDGETLLVFADSSSDAVAVADRSAFSEVDPSELQPEANTITRLQATWSSTLEAASYSDYDPAKPQLALEGHFESGGSLYEAYEHSGRYKETDQLERAAQLAVEARAAERLLANAQTPCLRLRPGLRFTIASAQNPQLEGDYLVRETRIIAVDHEVESSDTTAHPVDERAESGLNVTFTAQPLDTPYRPLTPDGPRRMPGPQSGIVCGPTGEELYTSDIGMIRVQPYWDREGQRNETSTTWVRVGQLGFGGSMILPRIGWEVLTEFHHDDVDQPFVSGHLYDAEHPVPYALPANKTRTAWQTATTPADGTANEIRFEDQAGSEEIFLNATKDMTVSIGDSSNSGVGANHTHEVGADRTIDVGAESQSAVTVDQTVTVAASESHTVSGNHQCSVTGADTVCIAASRSATIIMGSTVEANGGRTLTVGGSMTGVSGLGVSRAAMGSCSVTVGGSWISVAAAGLANATAGAASETVGAAKIQVAGSSVACNTMGALAENVGGAYISAAGGDAGETSGGPLVINVGGAFIAAGPKVHLKADSKIVVRVGGSTLTMTSSKVKLSAPSLASPGATIKKTGGTVKHN